MMRIGFLTVARSDYGHLRPILKAFNDEEAFDVKIIATGAHLSPEFGYTIDEILDDGFEVAERVEIMDTKPTSSGVCRAMGKEMTGLADVFERNEFDLVFIFGDRYEMLAASLAATSFNIRLAHLHGGEKTVGAIDDSLRHAITKLSHIHFVATERYKQRVIQLGEEKENVHVVGTPGLDNLNSLELLGREELESSLGVRLSEQPIMATFHPVTREEGAAATHVGEFIEALGDYGDTIILTYPGADAEADVIAAKLKAFTAKKNNAHLFESLGSIRYFSLMREAAAMVGNSSSGIIEAASFGLPVVNIGARQDGRERSSNVIDVPCEANAIKQGLDRALSSDCSDTVNVYGDGDASTRIRDIVLNMDLASISIAKNFQDLETW